MDATNPDKSNMSKTVQEGSKLGVIGSTIIIIGGIIFSVIQRFLITNPFTISSNYTITLNSAYFDVGLASLILSVIAYVILVLGVRNISIGYDNIRKDFYLGTILIIIGLIVSFASMFPMMSNAQSEINSYLNSTYASVYNPYAYMQNPYPQAQQPSAGFFGAYNLSSSILGFGLLFIVIVWLIDILAFYFVYRAYKSIGNLFGLQEFKTSAFLLLIGAIIPILGGILLLIGMIVAIIAWNKLWKKSSEPD
ncbi:MAG: DUF996 domain-containing protein [Candidatus Marsarchaeota archaeon]|nr:DUF996 domain-containing protein [Candidatus Marsarchaeota archaeon]